MTSNNNEVPHEISKIWFDFKWDVEKVWELDVPTEAMDVEELQWHLDYPLWDYRGEVDVLRPRDVLDNEEKYAEHFEKLMAADLSCPIDLMWWSERWMILDGVHRLAKAVYVGREVVPVRKIPRAAIAEIKEGGG